MKITFLTFSIFLSSILSNAIYAQRMPGVIGNRNLIGYTSEFIFDPVGFNHKIFTERMFGRRTNLGASFNFGKGRFTLGENDYISSGSISTTIDGKSRDVRYVFGKFKQSKSGFEIYIKRFSKKNQMRNFGWNWSYKFGQIRLVTEMQDGTTIMVYDPANPNNLETFENINNSRHVQTESFVGFEFGKTYPFYHDRLQFTFSGTVRLFLRSSDYYNIQLSQYIEEMSYDYLINAHVLNLNFSLAYAF